MSRISSTVMGFSSFNSLPEEIALEILTRVPTESVRDCKLVCQTWRNLVSNTPSFSKMHLHHLNHPSTAARDSGTLGFVALTGNQKLYYFEYDESLESIQRIARISFNLPPVSIDIIGSCNGLLCFYQYSRSQERTYICNPVTREYLVLPKIKTERENNDVYWEYGFGYIPSTNEYKVVSIMLTHEEYAEVHIYTLGSGKGWRNLGKFYFGAYKNWGEWGEGIFSNGVLYWLDNDTDMIVTFDLADEKFGEYLPPPPFQSDNSFSDYKTGVLDGFLFLSVRLDIQRYDVWFLKEKNDEDHGIKEQPQKKKSLCWTKEFRVDNSKLFAVGKTGKVLAYDADYINIYGTKPSTWKRLVDFEERINRVLPHKNTLVSLKELGEDDTKTTRYVPMKQL